MSSSVHIDNKGKVIVILGESLTRGFDDTPYPIFYLQKISLSALYHGTSRYFFLNGVEIIKFKSKDSEKKAFLLCLRNVSKDFSFDDNKDTEFYGYVYNFSVDYDTVAVGDILDIHNYFTKKHNIKKCLDLLQ